MTILFLYPTNHEAFGIAAVEAMRCCTPVIVSNKFSLPEVTNDAAILVDSTNEKLIADAVVRVLGSDQTKQRMIKRGLERPRPFS